MTSYTLKLVKRDQLCAAVRAGWVPCYANAPVSASETHILLRWWGVNEKKQESG